MYGDTVRQYLQRHEQALTVEETEPAKIDLSNATDMQLAMMYRALNSERNLIIDYNLDIKQLIAVNSLMGSIDNEYLVRHLNPKGAN